MTAIYITARMGSSRLPGKVLADVHGRPLLARLIERVSQTGLNIVVCTSMAKENQPIIDLCIAMDIDWGRGSEDDVMTRLINIAIMHQDETIIRVTADNPLTDPDIIKLLLKTHEKYNNNYTAISGPPAGTRAEVINIAALMGLRQKTTNPDLWENMTPALQSMSHGMILPCSAEIYAPDLRFTVDYPQDLTKIRQIYDAFDGKPPPLPEIIQYCRSQNESLRA